MPLSEILPALSQLSHQDKLRLIHFLLLAVAKEERCNLDTAEDIDLENLASTEAVVWSPQADPGAVIKWWVSQIEHKWDLSAKREDSWIK